MPTLPAVPSSDAPSEPLIKVGGIVGFLVALFAVLVSFGLHISDAQQSALLGFAAVAAPVAVVLWGRMRVWSPRSVRQVVNRAVAQKTQVLHTTTDTEVRDV